MIKTKVFAAYLPQYHVIPENNKFWGEGFTDWVGVKNAKPQFEGHKQPRVPLNENYYDLSDVQSIRWQAQLAKKYGISGFNIYHYWFKGGQNILGKPSELILEHPDIDIEFFFSWDNTSWIRSWGNIKGNAWAPAFESKEKNGKVTLLEFEYGDAKDWEIHFSYLLPFFKDKRYLKISNKPVFCLMNNIGLTEIKLMHKKWNELAKKNGFDGVFLMTGRRVALNKCVSDSQFTYQPAYSIWNKREAIDNIIQKYLHVAPKKDGEVKYVCDYKKAWNSILKDANKNIKKNLYFGGLVDFDDTPRRGSNARLLKNCSPKLFEYYFKKFYDLNCINNKELLFLTAWNEWGEGAYLEPDDENKYAYLEAVKKVVDSEIY